MPGITAENASVVQDILAGIASLERTAIAACRSDDFKVHLGLNPMPWLSIWEIAGMRRTCLKAIYRKMSMEYERLAKMGVTIEERETQVRWVSRMLNHLPFDEPDPIEIDAALRQDPNELVDAR